jgi:hypothetical protein
MALEEQLVHRITIRSTDNFMMESKMDTLDILFGITLLINKNTP